MSKTRVYRLAEDLGMSPQTLLALLRSWDQFAVSASSLVDPAVERRVRDLAAADPSSLRRREVGPIAGLDHVHYSKVRSEGGGLQRQQGVPSDAIVHAVRDREHRHPPYSPIFLNYNGADPRRAWCGAGIKIVLSEHFDADHPRACPDCLAALAAPADLVWRAG